MRESAFSDPLPPSTSSSDVGIREAEESNINLVSSSTLNDKGMSLHSFPIESEIFAEKTPLSIQTFLNDSFVRPSRQKGRMTASNFLTQIPPKRKTTRLVIDTFKCEINPVRVELSGFSSTIIGISSLERDFESCGSNTIDKMSLFRVQNVEALSLTSSRYMSVATFHHDILPEDKHAASSGNLKKLEKQMMALQSVFEKVRISREYNIKQTENSSGYIDIKLVIENASTQTVETSSQNTDFSLGKIESLILECEYVRAMANMIRRYPFYFYFLKRCYTDGNFDQEGKLRHLRPKQRSFKRAVIHACGCDKSHLEAINSILLDFFSEEKH